MIKNKFDVILANPPYPTRELGGMYLDMQFVQKFNKISNRSIVVHPANRLISKTKIANELMESNHLKSLNIYDANKLFGLTTVWKYVGVYDYDMLNIYEKIIITDVNNNIENINNDRNSREQYYEKMLKPQDLKTIIDRKKDLYNELISKNKTMVNDTESFIYEENRLQRGKRKYGITKKDNISLNRVKEYLKTGKYKFCIYKGSFNSSYDKVQEWVNQNPDKLFKGQICWLTNKENVKNNIKYWMECPLFDLWRTYYFYGYKGTAGCMYGLLPALKFDVNEKEFISYVDELNDFSIDEIKILQKNNIHNSNKLK